MENEVRDLHIQLCEANPIGIIIHLKSPFESSRGCFVELEYTTLLVRILWSCYQTWDSYDGTFGELWFPIAGQ